MNYKETITLKTSPQPALFRRASHLSSLALILLVAATGCHKKDKGLPPTSALPPTAEAAPSPTASITADPAAIDLGQSVVLNWRSSNATVVTIDGIGQVNLNGTQTVSPANSTNFHLVAKGDGGMVEANVRVTVRQRPVVTQEAPGVTTFPGGDAAAFRAAVQDVFFDYDSFDLRPDGQQATVAAAAYLVAHPNIRVLIGGYADERGSAEYNLALGENRANAAKTGLVNAGVAAARIRVISYGKEKQFCTEANETCWQENRRAQFTIDK
jgi:peptidoglycan-associated lipoprotein